MYRDIYIYVRRLVLGLTSLSVIRMLCGMLLPVNARQPAGIHALTRHGMTCPFAVYRIHPWIAPLPEPSPC